MHLLRNAEYKPRWTTELQCAADDIRASALKASEDYDLSYNDVMIAMVMAAATLAPKSPPPTEGQ